MAKKKKKSTKHKVDVSTILLTALADLLVGAALILIGWLADR